MKANRKFIFITLIILSLLNILQSVVQPPVVPCNARLSKKYCLNLNDTGIPIFPKDTLTCRWRQNLNRCETADCTKLGAQNCKREQSCVLNPTTFVCTAAV